MSGFMLCGTTLDLDGAVLAELLELGDIGFDISTVDGSTANSDRWGEVIYSCIARLSAINFTISYDQAYDWKALAEKGDPYDITIQFPALPGNATGGSVSFKGKVTSFKIRGQFEDRTTAAGTITPTGEPTLTLPSAAP